MGFHLLLNDWLWLLVFRSTWHLLVALANRFLLATLLTLHTELLLYAHKDIMFNSVLLLHAIVFPIPTEIELISLIQLRKSLLIDPVILQNPLGVVLQINAQIVKNLKEL